MRKIKEDVRPTTASWPKQIFELWQLPEQYHRFLYDWLTSGMPIGNITYIPKVHKYLKDSENVLAWFNDEVMILTQTDDNNIYAATISAENLISIKYFIQLLECRVTLKIKKDNKISDLFFKYNKVKEERIIPIFNILLGHDAEYELNIFDMSNSKLKELNYLSYSMFNISKLSYRLDKEVLGYFWERNKQNVLFGKRDEDPENFIAIMNRGITYINTDFYGIRTYYLPWKSIKTITYANFFESKEEKKFFSFSFKNYESIIITDNYNDEYIIPIIPQKTIEAKNFTELMNKYLTDSNKKNISLL